MYVYLPTRTYTWFICYTNCMSVTFLCKRLQQLSIYSEIWYNNIFDLKWKIDTVLHFCNFANCYNLRFWLLDRSYLASRTVESRYDGKDPSRERKIEAPAVIRWVTNIQSGSYGGLYSLWYSPFARLPIIHETLFSGLREIKQAHTFEFKIPN